MRTFGVEEELLLIDPESNEAVPRGTDLLHGLAEPARPGPALAAEFQQETIEVVSRPQSALTELAAEIRAGRARADAAARAVGVRVAALATSPLPADPHPVKLRRYQAMAKEYGLTAREQLTCGCHIHVSIDSEDEGVAVLDRIRTWLPVLSALSTNSPFWHGRDSSYASYRSQVWNRWPSAGPLEILGSVAAYRDLVQRMVETRVIFDEGMAYFDARLSRHYPTIEIRSTDVCLNPDHTVMLAGLTRALVETASRQWKADIPPAPVPAALLRLASWKAGRWGLKGQLLHPLSGAPANAVTVVTALVNHVGQALDETGDRDLVEDLIDQVLTKGTGASRQRATYHRTGSLTDVVAHAVAMTQALPAKTGDPF